tara:strand:- start:478 stop:1323 length:846 start_codon:yes stop_codon:yes gene_type:complete
MVGEVVNVVNPADYTNANVGEQTGKESSLSSWAGDYVTDMLGQGKALGNAPYQSYTGPLTAGTSGLQDQALSGIAGLAVPDNMGAYDPASFTDEGVAGQYMNPYIQQALNPQLEELRRQTDIQRQQQDSQYTKAGAYGGSRQAIADSELTRAMLNQMGQQTGTAYKDAYQLGSQQFNTEQQQGQTSQDAANRYGADLLSTQVQGGQLQRGIEQEGITADRLQFEEEREFPYKQVQYMQSLLQGLPISAQNVSYTEASPLSKWMEGSSGSTAFLNNIFGLGK